MKYKIALAFQVFYLAVALIFDLPGSWKMFARAQKLEFSISSDGRPIDYRQFLIPSQTIVAKEDVLTFFRFLCPRFANKLSLNIVTDGKGEVHACK